MAFDAAARVSLCVAAEDQFRFCSICSRPILDAGRDCHYFMAHVYREEPTSVLDRADLYYSHRTNGQACAPGWSCSLRLLPYRPFWLQTASWSLDCTLYTTGARLCCLSAGASDQNSARCWRSSPVMQHICGVLFRRSDRWPAV